DFVILSTAKNLDRSECHAFCEASLRLDGRDARPHMSRRLPNDHTHSIEVVALNVHFRSRNLTDHFAHFFDGISLPHRSRSVVAGEPASVKRSEEHTSELQSRGHLVCRLLLEKKKKKKKK